ncbi:hypothetical protein BRAO375_2220009 [Bradyrhizobium sp. ORS 375]|nr:hypothetical protein BRAO375_2220009 [Bradyrhizobium sp. ORS 375]
MPTAAAVTISFQFIEVILCCRRPVWAAMNGAETTSASVAGFAGRTIRRSLS